MSNLRPTTIVDKNGRTTTVHRRTGKRSSTGESLPAPKIAPQNSTQGTPLKPLRPATLSQTQKLMKEFETGEDYWPVNLNQMFKELSKKDQTLIRRLLGNPAVNNVMVFACIHAGAKDETIVQEEATNALLILERMYTQGNGHLLDTSGPYSLYHAVLGVDQVGTKPYLDDVQPITTEEELASKAAFVTFALLAEKNYKDGDSILRRRDKKFSFKYTREYFAISNKHLKELIMERPEQTHEIADYVNARGMHPSNKGPVKALREYLDEKTKVNAVREGWL